MGRMPNREQRLRLDSLADHLHAIRTEFPEIRPNREDDDILWFNEGLDALNAGRLNLAERTFKKLVLAQPDHPDAYHGLTMVYQAHGFIAWARLFADETIRHAQRAVDDGGMDQETLDEYIALRASLYPETPKSPDP